MGCPTVWWIAFLSKFKLILLIYQLILDGFCSNIPDFKAVLIPHMEPASVMVSTPMVVSVPVIPTQMSRCWYRGSGGQENRHRRRYRCRYHIPLCISPPPADGTFQNVIFQTLRQSEKNTLYASYNTNMQLLL